MNLTLFTALLACWIVLVSSSLKLNNEQENEVIKNFDQKLEENLAISESQLPNHVDKIKKNACPTLELAPPKSCASLYKSGTTQDGVYLIDPDGLGSFPVRCDMTTDGGGWTVFQRRQDGTENFFRGWSDYKTGFGAIGFKGEFWLGLDKIHRLTNSSRNVLRVDLMDSQNNTAFAKYGTFAVACESDLYKLSFGKFSGNAGDSLSYHNGMKFTTKDKDNDDSQTTNCAKMYKGGWWYKWCYRTNLNGRYFASQKSKSGITWKGWKNDYSYMKKAEMKIRNT